MIVMDYNDPLTLLLKQETNPVVSSLCCAACWDGFMLGDDEFQDLFPLKVLQWKFCDKKNDPWYDWYVSSMLMRNIYSQVFNPTGNVESNVISGHMSWGELFKRIELKISLKTRHQEVAY